MAPFPRLPFFIGAWVAPRTDPPAPQDWARFAAAEFDLAVTPLEDRNGTADNLETLALLDTLAGGRVRFLPRDERVHPDAATTPGWRERVRAVIRDMQGHPSLAGYFVADEPLPASFGQLAELTQAFAEEDDRHPAFVNVVGVAPTADAKEQARWRADLTSLIEQGRLGLFTFDRYAHTTRGEDAGFLLSLDNASRVAAETLCPFGAVLLLTGHGPFPPATLEIARYQAMEALAHGACGIIWFTYWTPNPREEPYRWHDGVVDYDGRPTSQYEAIRALNLEIRTFARFIDGRPLTARHLGGSWPRGSPVPRGPVPGLTRAEGGPLTIGYSSLHGGERIWMIVNRDVSTPHRFEFSFDSSVVAVRVNNPERGLEPGPLLDPSAPLALELEPGAAIPLTIGYRPQGTQDPGTGSGR
ncbi:MAG: hypothetical protein ACREOU_14265 [Candidatus Eiseniibacteriota bacterium]